jgi:hypothetical protein
VIGQTVRLDGKPHTVIGVLLAGGLACLDGAEIAFVPLAAEKIQDGPGVHYYQVVARLKPGVSVAQSQAAMTVLADALRKKNPRYGDWGVTLLSLREDQLGEWPDWRTIILLQRRFFPGEDQIGDPSGSGYGWAECFADEGALEPVTERALCGRPLRLRNSIF